MNEVAQKNTDFMDVYNKSYRLAAAIFVVSNIIDQNEELRTKMKKLSLDLVSMSVNLKDINFYDTRKLITDIEKNSLELMSMLDIASISGLVSKMNGGILKEEFQSFVLELKKFSEELEDNKNTSVKGIFRESLIAKPVTPQDISDSLWQDRINIAYKKENRNNLKNVVENGSKNNNGHKRKDLRKNMILDFVKGHNNVSIKDIAPNIVGCSEKTVQRELNQLINEGRIKKSGERRWSRYSIV